MSAARKGLHQEPGSFVKMREIFISEKHGCGSVLDVAFVLSVNRNSNQNLAISWGVVLFLPNISE